MSVRKLERMKTLQTYSWIIGSEEVPAVEEVVTANIFSASVDSKGRREA